MNTHKQTLISDLFFNHDHPNFDAFCLAATKTAKVVELRPDNRLAMRDAILPDAQDFLEAFDEILTAYAPEAKTTAEWLADDFLERL